MRSPITQASVLDEAPKDGWRIWTGTLGFASDFSISCAECNDSLDCGVDRGECSDGECKCHNGFVGDFCSEETASNCFLLDLFKDTGESYGLTYATAAEDWTVYGRPVYFRVDGENGTNIEVLLYTGRRWYDLLLNISTDEQELGDDGHAYWGNLLLDATEWYSEVTSSYLPTGPLKWYEVGESQNAGNYGPFGREIKFDQRFE